MFDLNLTDEQLGEAALRAALDDTLGAARLEGAARGLVRLWKGKALGFLTPDGKRALEALASVLGDLEATP